MQNYRRGIRSAQAGILVNALLAMFKVVAGFVGNSYALIADGVESTADILSSLIVWQGLQTANRPPDRSHPFGYGKAESIAAAVVSLMLLGAALVISIQALEEIRTPHHAPAWYTLLVLVVVIGVKEILYRRVFAVSLVEGSLAVKADAWHHRSDALTSAFALVGIGVALWGGPGWEAADDFAALAASVFIAYNGVKLLRVAFADLMDQAPEAQVLEQIQAIALQVEGVRMIEKTLARKVGTRLRVVMHIQADPDLTLRQAHDLGESVRRKIINELPVVLDVVGHMEPLGDNEDSQCN